MLKIADFTLSVFTFLLVALLVIFVLIRPPGQEEPMEPEPFVTPA